MPTQTWKVELHEATTNDEFAKTRVAARSVDTFGVNGDGVDGAKVAARKWLTDRGHTVRAINVSADKEKPRTLIAYVVSGSVAAAQNKNALARKVGR